MTWYANETYTHRGEDQMGETTLKRRLARLLLGLVLICAGSYLAWKSQEMSLGIFWNRLLAGVGGFVAVYGFMCVLGSGVLGLLLVLGGASFFGWSLWALSTGGGDIDVAKFGLWCGPLCGVVGLIFVDPFKRAKASRSTK